MYFHQYAVVPHSPIPTNSQCDLIILHWVTVGIPWQLTNHSPCQCQDCFGKNGISFENVTASWEACAAGSSEHDAIYTKSLRGCVTAAYALCIINKHIEKNHKRMLSCKQSPGSAANVWLYLIPPRKRPNKESFLWWCWRCTIGTKGKQFGCITRDVTERVRAFLIKKCGGMKIFN